MEDSYYWNDILCKSLNEQRNYVIYVLGTPDVFIVLRTETWKVTLAKVKEQLFLSKASGLTRTLSLIQTRSHSEEYNNYYLLSITRMLLLTLISKRTKYSKCPPFLEKICRQIITGLFSLIVLFVWWWLLYVSLNSLFYENYFFNVL